MTSKEAIRIIKSECYIDGLLDMDRAILVNTALDMAIEALRTEKSSDELLIQENESLRQQLQIAAKDIARLDGCNASDYLHDLSTRDYFEEIEK